MLSRLAQRLAPSEVVAALVGALAVGFLSSALRQYVYPALQIPAPAGITGMWPYYFGFIVVAWGLKIVGLLERRFTLALGLAVVVSLPLTVFVLWLLR